jgi:hypothetical protein
MEGRGRFERARGGLRLAQGLRDSGVATEQEQEQEDPGFNPREQWALRDAAAGVTWPEIVSAVERAPRLQALGI